MISKKIGLNHTRATIFVGATVLLLTTGFVFFHPVLLEQTVSVTEIETFAQDLHAEEWVSEVPIRLRIPAINVDAFIQTVGLAPDNSGAMDVPSNFVDVGWYEYGVRPGMNGSAVIAGHYNGRNESRAVFYDLDQLMVGDEVIVESAERIEDIFRVVRIETFAHDAETYDVFQSNDGLVKLNLITCGGKWLSAENMYDERTVIFTESITMTD